MKAMENISNNKQSGAVSLFVVIFAMLIVTVMTVSFLRIMMTDLSQSSDNDLSQSAYDSAEAGVEDAKRALLAYQQTCAADQSSCGTEAAKVTSSVCNAGLTLTGVVSTSNAANSAKPDAANNPGEITVRQTSSTTDKELNQAYTCVTMELETEDYIGELSSYETNLVPLIGVEDFDTVTIEWFSTEDVSNETGSVELDSIGSGNSLDQTADWSTERPSVMRAQLIQFGTSFTLDQFDYTNASQFNASTVFLYPSNEASAVAPPSTVAFSGTDIRSSGPGDNPDADTASSSPKAISCKDSVADGGYSCMAILSLPNSFSPPANAPSSTNSTNRSTAYLRLTSLYNTSHFRVRISNGVIADENDIVKFKDVQPIIDSTGRTNDLFRRVKTRVNLYDTTFPYPDATIDVTNNFCKDFGVTDTSYIAGTCAP